MQDRERVGRAVRGLRLDLLDRGGQRRSSSAIAWAPRPSAISNTLSSVETTHVSHPSTARVASRTSSNIASASAPRSNDDRSEDSRDFA